MLAHSLHLEDAGDRFLSKLFPGVNSPVTSEDITTALCRDTSKFLGHSFGIKDWRQAIAAFSAAHRDPDATLEMGRTNVDNELRGHSNGVAETNYANNPTDPAGVSFVKLQEQTQAAHWWYSLTGMVTLSLIQLHRNSQNTY
jgi:hypothetical protein